jgi:O-acetyl-ADP-ribose deacetylase (regulator of RNase III)
MNTVLVDRSLPTGQIIQIVQGDITIETTDAIVNAANDYLQHGGVAWAIVQRGGDVIQEESDAWIQQHGLVSHSHPAWTSGGMLPAKYVIHAVGPVWGDTQRAGAGGNEDKKLVDAVSGSLRVADELKLTSISMPAISTGIFGFPKDCAAKIIFKTIQKYFDKRKSGLKIVRLVLLDQTTIDVFIEEWKMENGE